MYEMSWTSEMIANVEYVLTFISNSLSPSPSIEIYTLVYIFNNLFSTVEYESKSK